MPQSIYLFRSDWLNLCCSTRELYFACARLLDTIGLYIDVLLNLYGQTLQ